MQKIGAAELARMLTDRSTKGIARDTAKLVRNGELTVGLRLPSLRDLAYEMSISPSTLSEAWKELRRLRVLTGRGRNGTYISGSSLAARPARWSSQGHFSEGTLDLTLAAPDTAFLPNLIAALTYGAQSDGLNSYERVRILPKLEEILRPLWPYDAPSMLATNGGYNALYVALHALVQPGAAVALEMPAPMRILDILEDLGVEILPVESDVKGPRVDSLSEALKRKPTAFVFQPSVSSVTGHYVCAKRLKDLGRALAKTDTLIIEDDGLGDISGCPNLSLGTMLPNQVVHIRSFSKSYGPDLRMGVLSATEDLVEQIQSYRAFSAGWTSRILQGALAWLLADADTQTQVAHAAEKYKTRRNALARNLRARGLDVPDGGGLCLLLPVYSETFAMITFAAHGISVAPGEIFSFDPTGHIRISTSQLDATSRDRVANVIQLAVSEPWQDQTSGSTTLATYPSV